MALKVYIYTYIIWYRKTQICIKNYIFEIVAKDLNKSYIHIFKCCILEETAVRLLSRGLVGGG